MSRRRRSGGRRQPALGLAVSLILGCGRGPVEAIASTRGDGYEDAGGAACRLDSDCDDGVFCNGMEACTPGSGCRPGTDPCDDDIECTVDTCNERAATCNSAPREGSCQPGESCRPGDGCSTVVYANSADTLFVIYLPSGAIEVVGNFGAVAMSDIALMPNGDLYGVSFSSLYMVDRATGRATPVATIDAGMPNALGAGSDGALLVGSGTVVLAVDVATGATHKAGAYPEGMPSSGDIAFVDGRLVGSVSGPQGDLLVELHADGAPPAILGPIGASCVWGLAGHGASLFGFTCDGRILRIDAEGGGASELASTNVEFWGASGQLDEKATADGAGPALPG